MNLESFAAPLPARSSLKNHHICQKNLAKAKENACSTHVQLTFKRLGIFSQGTSKAGYPNHH